MTANSTAVDPLSLFLLLLKRKLKRLRAGVVRGIPRFSGDLALCFIEFA